MSAADYQEEVTNIRISDNVKKSSSDFTNKVMPIWSKMWQPFTIWRVTVMKGSLVIYYTGENGGVIFCNRKTLENVTSLVKREKELNTKGKGSFQFQECNYNHISRCITNKAGTASPLKVGFKFARVSYGSNKCLLYQNNFEVVQTSENMSLGPCVQSTMIEMSINDFLSPLNHIATQTITNKTDDMNMGDIDID